MPGFKKVFIQHVLKGHNYHVWWTLKTRVFHQWLSESGTKWAVMLLHIVISDCIVKEACLSCLFVPRFIGDSVERRTRHRLKQFKQHLWQHVLIFNADVFYRTEVTTLTDMSGYSSWYPYRTKTFLLLIAHAISCCTSLTKRFWCKSAKTSKIIFFPST